MGVNCFVLITGYFSCKNPRFRWKGIIKFFLQVTIFSIAIYGVFWATGAATFSMKSLLYALCPLFWGSAWWFASTYFVLLLFSPHINKFIMSVSQKGLLGTVVLMCVLWSLMDTFMKASMQNSNLAWFVFLYLLAAYIRLYSPKFFDNEKIQGVLCIVTTSIVIGSVLLFDVVGTKYAYFGARATYFAGIYKTPLLLQSVSLFCLFKNLKLKDSKVINFVAAAMFGVYLLHDHDLMRTFLWIDLFQNAFYQDSAFLIVHAVVVITIVFVGATCISMLYNITIGKLVGFCMEDCEARWNALDTQSHKWMRKITDYCKKYFM